MKKSDPVKKTDPEKESDPAEKSDPERGASFILSYRHGIGHYFRWALRFLIALAAVLNLVALFVFHYELPSWLRQAESPTFQPAAATEPPAVSEKLSIPVIPVNYSGEAELDELIMGDVYLMGSDRQPVDDAVIRYEILPGESRRKKIIRYTTTLESGETLTEDRDMNLTTRYTGPTITLLGALPDIDPANEDRYLGRLLDKNVFRADDGFGNDMTEQVTIEFSGLSDENPNAEMTLRLENQIHDAYEKTLTVDVYEYTGVVLTLSDYDITLRVGDEFDPRDYIAVAHDTEGYDLTESVVTDGAVDTDQAGEYEIWYWVADDYGVYSPTKKLNVVVEPGPGEEETGESEAEAP